jgi:hypothetical protein
MSFKYPVGVKTVVWHSMKIMEEERCEPRLNTEFTGHVIISCDICPQKKDKYSVLAVQID